LQSIENFRVYKGILKSKTERNEFLALLGHNVPKTLTILELTFMLSYRMEER